jgi:hypothetical protein
MFSKMIYSWVWWHMHWALKSTQESEAGGWPSIHSEILAQKMKPKPKKKKKRYVTNVVYYVGYPHFSPVIKLSSRGLHTLLIQVHLLLDIHGEGMLVLGPPWTPICGCSSPLCKIPSVCTELTHILSKLQVISPLLKIANTMHMLCKSLFSCTV